MDNQQLNLLSREQLQVFFSRVLGDGGIYHVLRTEKKKDGRIFYYLCINKYKGAAIISQILNKYPVNCYSYKRWSSETILQWSKVQEYLKNTGKVLSSREMGVLMKTL